MKRLLIFCLGFIITFSSAQDGSPDLSFGDNGVVIHEMPGDDHWIQGVGEKSNSNFLVLIKTFDYMNDHIERVFAFHEDGTIDTSFSNNGVLDISNPEIDYSNLIVLPNDSFFVIGYTDYVYTVLKFDAEGNLDSSFGDNGQLQPYVNGVSGSSIIVNDDQSLFFLGNQIIQGEPHILFYKFLENGIPDTSFGDNGVVLYSLGNVTNAFASFRKKDDFFYLGIGFLENSVQTRNVYRFFMNGEIDGSYGTNGRVIISMEEQYSTSFNVFNDGNILVGGSYWDSNTESFVRKTIKINPLGQIDQSFGNDGVINGFSGSYIQGNQRFILNGTFFDFEGGASPFFLRFYPNGNLDTSFQFTTNYQELSDFAVNHLQNGKILLVGSDVWYNGPEINIIFQRFNNSPLSIPDFEHGKIKVYPNPSSGIFQVQCETIFNNQSFEIFDSMGKIVLSGLFNENSPSIDLSNAESGVYFLKIDNIFETVKLLKK